MTAANRESWSRLRELVDRSTTFLLSGHVHIDGDSLGSMLGMYHFLQQRGKQVRALAFEPLADRYAFLGGDRIVETFDPKVHAQAARDSDVFMMFDFSSTSRMPGLWDLVKSGRSVKVCVDHHVTDVLPGDLNLHDPSAPATGKIVLELVKEFGGRIDRKIAESLLVAISTDTGWFRYSNTDVQVLRDAAELLSAGIDASRVYREVYQRNETALVRLIGRVAAEVNSELDGKILWGTIPIALIDELKVGPFETDELLDLLRTARDAECVALFRETREGEVRINLRSRGQVDVAKLARSVGGGGHTYAAGATIAGPLRAAAERVVARLKDAWLESVKPSESSAADRRPSLPTRVS